MSKILQVAVDFVWGLPLLGLILVANIVLVYHSKFLPLRGCVHAIKLLTKKEENTTLGDGQITHFQAFCNATAATVGLGNISGVAVAISMGGPGVLLWMWIAAIFGMNTKFFECTAAQMYRGKDHKGEVQGGAMYIIEQIFSKKWHFLSVLFALCGLIGTLSLFQINQLAQFGDVYYGIEKWHIGAFFAIITATILLKGLSGISKACSTIVPFMSLTYIVVVLIILGTNYEKIPNTLALIFKEALNPSSAFAGISGYGFIHILITGTKRATFSNEAGIGTAPMAHSNSKTKKPISEGYVAMLGPFLDTVIICSLTALVILVSFPEGAPLGVSGIELTTRAFEMHLGDWGKYFLGLSVVMFGFSTILGMANYNQKCWDYLFKGRLGLNDKVFLALYSCSLIIGATIPLANVINLMDLAFAFMTIPNVIATVYLAKRVKAELEKYNREYGL